ncbi:hypothetical protein V8B97DRAFT_1938679 [Scleroderma yunnanense]
MSSYQDNAAHDSQFVHFRLIFHHCAGTGSRCGRLVALGRFYRPLTTSNTGINTVLMGGVVIVVSPQRSYVLQHNVAADLAAAVIVYVSISSTVVVRAIESVRQCRH